MKILLPFLSLLFVSASFSQEEAPTPPKPFSLPRFERSFGVSYELGGGFSFPDSAMGVLLNLGMPFGLKINPTRSSCYSVFYEQQVNKNGWGYSIGIGLNATVANYDLAYRNPMVLLTEPNGDQVVYNANPQSHKMRSNTIALGMDIPLTLSYAFRLRERSLLRPYVGMKARNIVHIVHETYEKKESSSGPDRVGIGQYDVTMSEQKIDGYAEARYGTSSPTRIVLFAFAGIKGSYLMKNGGAINYFADYNAAFFNHLEVYLSNFKSTERVSMKNMTTGEEGTALFTYMHAGVVGQRVALALEMSAVRIGVSYSLPARKEK